MMLVASKILPPRETTRSGSTERTRGFQGTLGSRTDPYHRQVQDADGFM